MLPLTASGALVGPSPAHAAAGQVRISEVTSNGPVDDWVELVNPSSEPVDLSGWYLLDDDDSKDPSVIAEGTVLQPGEMLVIDRQQLGFGLGKGDQARLFSPDGELIDIAAWPDGEHAVPSWQREEQPDGEFALSHVATPGERNAVGDVVITETNSQGEDFVELGNLGEAPVDIGGYRVLDDDDEHVHEIAASTTLQPGEQLLITRDELGFGLGGEDMVRLQGPDGELLGQVSWSEHITPSTALCEGYYVPSAAPTPGAANDCGELEEGETLPTDGQLVVADEAEEFGEDLSGLDLQVLDDGTQVLWAVNNDLGQVSRLVQDEQGTWIQSEGWPTGGQRARFADGTGEVDGEGISVGQDGRVYISVERDNADGGVSRNTILALDPSDGSHELIAQDEWNLTDLLPATGANAGLEGIEMVPASALANLVDEVPQADAYALTVLEATGDIYALALHDGGEAELLATLPTQLPALMALDVDDASGELWAFADEAYDGRSLRIDLGAADPAASATLFARADGMGDVANEGVALEPTDKCADGVRQAWFADDADTDGHALRGIGLLDDRCTADEAPAEETEDPAEDGSEDGAGSGAEEGAEDDAPAGGSGSDDTGQDDAGQDDAAHDEQSGSDAEETPAGSADPAADAGDAADQGSEPADGAAPAPADQRGETAPSPDPAGRAAADELARTGFAGAGLLVFAAGALGAGFWLTQRARARS